MTTEEQLGRDISGIRRILRSNFSRLKLEFNISSLEVFGSYVRGEETPGSDVDLLVQFDVPPSLFRFIALEDELAKLLRIRVDLVMKDGLKPSLGAAILREALPI